MVCRPVPPDGVYVTEQLADAPAPLRLQLPGVKVPLPPLLLKDTVPVGVIAVPVSVSVTVAVHVVGWPKATVDGVQLTLVSVFRFGGSRTTVLPRLPECDASPP